MRLLLMQGRNAGYSASLLIAVPIVALFLRLGALRYCQDRTKMWLMAVGVMAGLHLDPRGDLPDDTYDKCRKGSSLQTTQQHHISPYKQTILGMNGPISRASTGVY